MEIYKGSSAFAGIAIGKFDFTGRENIRSASIRQMM